jgi:hypothetical protein
MAESDVTRELLRALNAIHAHTYWRGDDVCRYVAGVAEAAIEKAKAAPTSKEESTEGGAVNG